jgi:hypothetical protein
VVSSLSKIGQMGKCRISIIMVILIVNFVVLVQMRYVHLQNVMRKLSMSEVCLHFVFNVKCSFHIFCTLTRGVFICIDWKSCIRRLHGLGGFYANK